MSSAVRAMVFAAGLGTRLRPMTDALPKPVVPLMHRPLCWFALDHLRRAGVTEVVLNTHHLAHRVEEEIARQLRLRDLGGVIINDFIDMESEANRRTVERALRAALRGDRAKSWISRISRFGIIEMTRQRVRPSFERSQHEPCKLCRGTGIVKSAKNTGIAILRQVRSALSGRRKASCEISAHSSVVDYLLNERRDYLVSLEREFGKRIHVRVDSTLGPEQYAIRYP